MTRPARVRIDRSAARHNLERVRQLAPGRRVMAIVKADAYGHGLPRMAEAFAGADAFGVASLDEALLLREAGALQSIVLLEGPFAAGEIVEIAAHGLDTVIHCFEQVRYLEQAAIDAEITVWLKVDSGMNRLGFPPEAFAEAYRRLRDCPLVHRELRLMSHFANAHKRGDPTIEQQSACFQRTTAGYPGARSLANSAALLSRPESHADWVRPGLMLYGVSPFAGESGAAHDLRPVMTLCSQLIAVRTVAAGQTVGYGGDWRAERDTPIGIVAMGYGDGYPRHARSGTPVRVRGRAAALIGRISMDMLAVDLSGVEAPRVGDPVVLWGADLPVETVADWADTAPYELLCGVPVRVRYEDAGHA